jgi:hypothetical protein
MKTFAQQLATVGFQPSPMPTHQPSASKRPLITHAVFEDAIDGAIAPLIKVRKIQVTRCGSHWRARYEGTSDCAFGTNPVEATSRVKMFSGSSRHMAPFTKEDSNG